MVLAWLAPVVEERGGERCPAMAKIGNIQGSKQDAGEHRLSLTLYRDAKKT